MSEGNLSIRQTGEFVARSASGHAVTIRELTHYVRTRTADGRTEEVKGILKYRGTDGKQFSRLRNGSYRRFDSLTDYRIVLALGGALTRRPEPESGNTMNS